jgi:phenylpropionate dioxygenase-like ring-hydroxylating dioxygenase large terminal subunit
MYRGWTQVAFAEDVREDVVPVDVGGRALVAVRRFDGYAVHDGRCPHRGAHLGHGGRLDGDFLVCPFHGHRVLLTGESDRRGGHPFCVRRYPSLHLASGLFVLFDGAHDTGLGARLAELERTHHVHPAFTRDLAVPPEYVIENVLDADHFAVVHALTRRPELQVREEPAGSLIVDGHLDMVRANTWQSAQDRDGGVQARFTAQVFSPTVVVTELGSGEDRNVIITAATPTAHGGCTARVTVALPKRSSQGSPTVRQLSSLVSGSRTAFEQDARVWEHLDTTVTPQYLPGDHLVRTYRDFCARFQGS